MTKVRLNFNQVRDACYRAVHGGDKSELLHLLRSGYHFTPDDLRIVADLIEGKIKPKRGRKVNLGAHAELKRCAIEVARFKLEQKKLGIRVRHLDAIDAVANCLFPSDLIAAADVANKLDNFIRRSKQRKKPAR